MASQDYILKKVINELLIKEIGEANITPLDYYKRNFKSYNFLIVIDGKKVKVEVDFQQFLGKEDRQYFLPIKYEDVWNTWNVAYSVGDSQFQFTKTNIKVLLTILSTVVDIVKDFIKTESPECLYIEGTGKSGEDKDIRKKSTLYSAFIWKQLDTIPNYAAENRRDGFIIYKPTK